MIKKVRNMMNFATENSGLKEARKRVRYFADSWEMDLDLSDLGLEQLPQDIIENLSPDMVHSLNLSRNRIEELPAFIDAFTDLEFLDISNNRLSRLPESFTNLASLKKLKLSDNDLTELPENIDKLSKLEVLDVSRNKLTRLPDAIKNIRSLKGFDFNLNKLIEVPNSVKKFTAYKKTSILTHIRKLADMVSENGLTEDFFALAKPHIKAVSEKFHTTPVQAAIYAQFLIRYEDTSIYLREIAGALNLSSLEFLPYMDEFDALERKKLLFCRRPTEGEPVTYRVPIEIIDALRWNKPYKPETYENLSIDAFFDALEKLFNQHGSNELAYDIFLSELDALLAGNMQLAFSQKIQALCLPPAAEPPLSPPSQQEAPPADKAETLSQEPLSAENKVLLLRFCQRLVSCNDDRIGFSDIGGIFSDPVYRKITQSLGNGDHELIRRGIVEKIASDDDDDDFFGDFEHFSLSSAAKGDLLAELNLNPRKAAFKRDNLISASGIAAKKMFYNKKEEERISELGSLLTEDKFKAVQQRLVEKGLRDGFVCLFSGLPGTGKTETVYQLARESGRDLMSVKITDIQSKWVGESEKNLKAVFDTYREAAKSRERTPILLFNEADGIISKRLELNSQSRSIDQMMNSLQSIILDEMEKLSGIMIATTNLTQNMDKAFERRFLYKIEFEKPGLSVRQSIWQSLVPNLSESDGKALAVRFEFSGGQIENIARKSITDYVLSGVETPFEKLLVFCKEELLAKPEKPIGFIA
jgi:hypothetical protein